jgi:hypothetical protein
LFSGFRQRILYAISDEGHRIYHMLIRHGLRFGCIIIIGVYSHVGARFTCFRVDSEHVTVTSFMKSMTQMEEEQVMILRPGPMNVRAFNGAFV